MKYGLLLLMACMGLIGLTVQANSAGLACGDRTSLLKALGDKYKETPRAIGLSSSGKAVFEVYTSKTGTWTIVMTTTKGVTCIMAAGHSWEDMPRKAEHTRKPI